MIKTEYCTFVVTQIHGTVNFYIKKIVSVIQDQGKAATTNRFRRPKIICVKFTVQSEKRVLSQKGRHV